jgi:hypothetical protein
MMALCIDPARAAEFWPHVSPMIAMSLPPGGISRFADVENNVLSGANFLWIAWDGRNVKAAVVTELQKIDDDKICVIIACGGHDMRQWVHLIKEIEDYAWAEGCKKVRIWARPGWTRVLKSYGTSRVILERRLGMGGCH